jgi:muramoyltetrapeptide carboxypeptidase
MGKQRTRLAGNPLPPGIRHVAVIAPASPDKPEKVAAAVALVEAWGVRVTVMPSAVASCTDPGGRSADEATRLADIRICLEDRSVDLLWCVRGGYGSVQLLDAMDWPLFASRNLPLLGYSDITGMLLAMRAKGIGVPIAAPTFTSLPKLLDDPWSLDSFRRTMATAMEPLSVRPPPRGRAFRVLRKGSASGPLIPVNLSLLCSLLGTPFLPDLRGSILLVEDINEPVYKLDRMLTQLAQAGILGGCAGLLFGNFRRCGNATARKALQAKFAEFVPGPVVAELPFGHCFPRLTLRVGQPVHILPDGEIRIG